MREWRPDLFLFGNAVVQKKSPTGSALVLTSFRSLVEFCTSALIGPTPLLLPKWFNPEPLIGWAVEDESILASG